MNILTSPNPFTAAMAADPAVSDKEPDKFEHSLDEELEFLWEDCDPSGNSYDLYLGRISRSPVVRSHATGKYFMLPWSRIIELAAPQIARHAASPAAEVHSEWGLNE